MSDHVDHECVWRMRCEVPMRLRETADVNVWNECNMMISTVYSTGQTLFELTISIATSEAVDAIKGVKDIKDKDEMKRKRQKMIRGGKPGS
ncbi:hypothetical protein K505DRAFT_330392 [Melanomma pulvis-pyrius CBS 109.77]|uniref:Uncharacterized protein n=1 Tax=Melanomma pulvis-pyrius CBS 109.77 TaxID=1314802 RepID=A0A6A6WR00_9PLEO|nr:hypothetical protein K505DRAFT_330392 [Melanomma pulvis-pyrius CBS 109.77]